MNLVELDIKQIKKIYNERMVYDFPQNELRPLARIIGPLRQGKYECFGLNDGDNIIGYVYLTKQDNDYLVDYLAMYPKYRNKGLGGEMLCLLKEYLSGAEEYDNIFVCGPCWWGTFPMAVLSQLERLDLAGKTLFPVMTHEGSGLGSSARTLKKVCRKATVGKGLAVQGSKAADSRDTVTDWARCCVAWHE